jgi:hypothetical protein
LSVVDYIREPNEILRFLHAIFHVKFLIVFNSL